MSDDKKIVAGPGFLTGTVRGESKDIAIKEVKKLILPGEQVEHYPTATLVVNPMDTAIPDEQKVVVAMKYEFTGGLYAHVWFKGAAVVLKNDPRNAGNMAFQIAVLQQDGEKPTRAKAQFMTDPHYLKGTDIELAKDAMLEMIKHPEHGLIQEVAGYLKEAINKAKIDYSLGKRVSMPWFVQDANTHAQVHPTLKRSVKDFLKPKPKVR